MSGIVQNKDDKKQNIKLSIDLIGQGVVVFSYKTVRFIRKRVTFSDEKFITAFFIHARFPQEYVETTTH